MSRYASFVESVQDIFPPEQQTDGDARARGGEDPPKPRNEDSPPLQRVRDSLWWVRPVFCVVLGVLLGYADLGAWWTSAFLRVPALLAALILVAQGPLDFSRQSRYEGLHQRQFKLLAEWRAELAKYRDELERRRGALDEREHRLEDREHQLDRQQGRDRDGDEPGLTVVHADNVYAETSGEPDRIIVHPAYVPANATPVPPQRDRLKESIEAQTQLERAARASTGDNRSAVLLVLVLAIWLGLATLSYSTAPVLLLRLSLVAAFLLFASAWGMLQGEPD